VLHSSLNGKTTAPPIAGFIPMDGFHFTRAQLSAMPDPEQAHARRGAAFTFDGLSFLSLVQRLRQPLSANSQILYAPSFDHAVKDPKENDIPIAPSTRILVFEGNYLSLDREPWNRAAELMDELWFVEVEFETAKGRLVPRHVKAGIAPNKIEAEKRVTENDLVNGKEIVEERMDVHEIVISRDDEAWRSEVSGVGK
jgi:pantothenate kinase